MSYGALGSTHHSLHDLAVLRAVHLGMKHKTTPTTVLLLDAAASRFRKGLAELIAQEEAGKTT